MNDFLGWRSRGIPLRKINILMAAVTLVISGLLLFTTYQTSASFRALKQTTDQYLKLNAQAYELQLASDYLTEQARSFAETGDRTYLDNYFEESEVTRRRDKALKALEEVGGDTHAYHSLEKAMSESVELMQQEYYSMRLVIASMGYAIEDFPQALQEVRLDGQDARLDAEGQSELARRTVFNTAYRNQKNAISRDIQECLNDLNADMDAKQQEASNQMNAMLARQQALITALIVLTLAIVLLTSLLVISPLVRAVLHIRADEEIPVQGSYEFRFLANTYNLMYEVNQQSKQQLAFEASHDKLTGLYNRAGYEHIMATANLKHIALLLVDVDYFKQINDTFGHETGDRVLSWIASVIRSSFRSQDRVCRIGGDEFIVIMESVGPAHSDLISRKIDEINQRLSAAENDTPPASVSVGVAFGGEGLTPKTLFDQADEALYQVKRHGRKSCAFYG